MNPGFKPFTDEHECLSYRKKERKKEKLCRYQSFQRGCKHGKGGVYNSTAKHF